MNSLLSLVLLSLGTVVTPRTTSEGGMIKKLLREGNPCKDMLEMKVHAFATVTDELVCER
jgi:hypothetical protein